MENNHINRLNSFGEPDCESELKILGADEYSHYYFPNIRFNHESLKPTVYLIVGRRGSGKTALAQFFSFQKIIPNTVAIDVDEPAAFQTAMAKLATNFAYSREVAIPGIVKVWELVIWSIIFRQFQAQDQRLKAACMFFKETSKAADFIWFILDSLAKKYVGIEDSITNELNNFTSQQAFQKAKSIILEIAKNQPIIVAFDTLENYSLDKEEVLRAVAALIQFAALFNQEYASKNIHIKLFVMDEIFPHLKDEVVTNTLKYIKDEVYLYWRPKDLIKIICWRFWRYLIANQLVDKASKEIDWDNHHTVLKEIWEPYFGSQLVNGSGLPEKTFPYVLRHTQLRPRQLIVLCNTRIQ